MPVARGDGIKNLKRLAHLYRIQTSYRNVAKSGRRAASPEALLAVVRALGAPVNGLRDAGPAALARELEISSRVLDPVAVAWNGRSHLNLRLPARLDRRTMTGLLELDNGENRRFSFNLSEVSPAGSVIAGGQKWVCKEIPLPGRLPYGYHQLQLEIDGVVARTLIIAAPSFAYEGLFPEDTKAWGIFVPLYALHSNRTMGAGDIRELDAIADWTLKLKGCVVSTLPILATFLNTPYDPSPYAPASRLFWNEFYLDVKRIPEWDHCPPARALRESSEVKNAVEMLRSRTLIDYRETMKIKRRILESLARCFYSHSAGADGSFQQFLKDYPRVEDYAGFRAACERKGAGWNRWSPAGSDGVLGEDDYDPEVQRYHVYVQWQMREQLRSLAEKYRRRGLTFCLDLPLGIHPQSYDVWRERQIFALGMHGGAPPDAVFTKGQDWGFPPLNPETIRAQGYRYYIDCLRHQMAHAGMLRADHIMGLHRLFWIPEGLEAQEGVYVHYRAEELYAILTLESWRNHSMIIGENLGTVPAYVNAAMIKHRVKQMYVLQYELAVESTKQLREPSSNEIASLNTHDMPTFRAFLQGLDIEDRQKLNLLNEANAAAERKTRELQRRRLIKALRTRGWLRGASPDARTLLQASLELLSACDCPVTLVNLEDLWLETEPQNMPTARDRPNWQRKLRHAQEVFCGRAGVIETLRAVASVRRSGERIKPKA